MLLVLLFAAVEHADWIRILVKCRRFFLDKAAAGCAPTQPGSRSDSGELEGVAIAQPREPISPRTDPTQ